MGSSFSKFICGCNKQADQINNKYVKEEDKQANEKEISVGSPETKPVSNKNVYNASATVHGQGQRSKTSFGQGTLDMTRNQMGKRNNTKENNSKDIKRHLFENGINIAEVQLENIPYADETNTESLQINEPSGIDEEMHDSNSHTTSRYKRGGENVSQRSGIQHEDSEDSTMANFELKHYTEKNTNKETEESKSTNKMLFKNKQMDSSLNKSSGSEDTNKESEVKFDKNDTRYLRTEQYHGVTPHRGELNLEPHTASICGSNSLQSKELSDKQDLEVKAEDECKHQTAVKQIYDSTATNNSYPNESDKQEKISSTRKNTHRNHSECKEDPEAKNTSRSNKISKSTKRKTKTNVENRRNASNSSDSSESSETSSSELDTESDEAKAPRKSHKKKRRSSSRKKYYKAENMQFGPHSKMFNQKEIYYTKLNRSSKKKSHKREPKSTRSLHVNTRNFTARDIQTNTTTIVSTTPKDGKHYSGQTTAGTNSLVPSGAQTEIVYQRGESNTTANVTDSGSEGSIETDPSWSS